MLRGSRRAAGALAVRAVPGNRGKAVRQHVPKHRLHHGRVGSGHADIYGGIRGIRDYRSAMNIYLPGGGSVGHRPLAPRRRTAARKRSSSPTRSTCTCCPNCGTCTRRRCATSGSKRKMGDPWALCTTTACRIGEQSVWETLEKQWRKGLLGPEWLVHHREAKGRIDIRPGSDDPATPRGVRPGWTRMPAGWTPSGSTPTCTTRRYAGTNRRRSATS